MKRGSRSWNVSNQTQKWIHQSKHIESNVKPWIFLLITLCGYPCRMPSKQIYCHKNAFVDNQPRATISLEQPWSWSVVWVDLLILEVFDSRRCSWCASFKCPLKSVFFGMIPQASATTSRLDPIQVCFWSFWRHRDAMLRNTLPSLRKWRPTPTVGFRRVSTGIVVGNMGEHGVKYHEVPWLLPWGLGVF